MENNIYLPPCQVIPNALTITAITQAYPMVVTVSQSNLYMAGQNLHFSIPADYGMQQLNQQTATILSVSGLNFLMNLDSTLFDPFAVPGSGEKPATVAPAGSNNLQYNNLTGRVPFQNLNGNIGN
jgi:hypothetical protein